ncbi:hypothetical protein DFJ73DRAFT_21468 [Zopfochytrium polystomum]|nr:hypothetical protein DFJ73DRAFT_21468 [Zopfochytrium polystomum]
MFALGPLSSARHSASQLATMRLPAIATPASFSRMAGLFALAAFYATTPGAPPSLNATMRAVPRPALPAPKRASNAFALFVKDFFKDGRQRNPELARLTGSGAQPAVMKAAAKAWASLSPKEKKPYTDKQEQEKERYAKELSSYLKNRTAVDIAAASAVRRALLKLNPSRRRFPVPIDPARPKRPLTAFILFSQAATSGRIPRYAEEMKPLTMTQKASAAGKHWKSLSAAEKEPFEKQALLNKQRYDLAKAKYDQEFGYSKAVIAVRRETQQKLKPKKKKKRVKKAASRRSASKSRRAATKTKKRATSKTAKKKTTGKKATVKKSAKKTVKATKKKPAAKRTVKKAAPKAKKTVKRS